MGSAVRNEVHLEPLIAIASEELGIRSLTQSGKVTEDIRLVRIERLAAALERAYEFGLLMGHSVARAEHPKSSWSKLKGRDEQEWVRSAAVDILGATWRDS
ncbi:MAG TPA: hypothetical protein VHU21_06985 [Paraburkholderia sp.]|jgi:hypothetical protein|nr:hypothetical protein [Paraburkholderia sp.]